MKSMQPVRVPGGFIVPMDVDNVFTYHKPKDDQPARYEKIRADAKLLAKTIEAMTPQSREQSLALTNLQQSVMWANAAIAINEAETT